MSDPSNSMVWKMHFRWNWKDFDSEIIRRHRVQWPPMDLSSFFNKNLSLKPSNMQRVLVGKQCNEPRCCINHRCNTRFFQLVMQVWQMIQQELTKKEQSDMQNHETSAWETGGKNCHMAKCHSFCPILLESTKISGECWLNHVQLKPRLL